MSTLKLVVVIGFLIAFGAGMVTGMRLRTAVVLADPLPVAGPTTGPLTRQGRQPLDVALGLSEEQKKQAKLIWDKAFAGSRERDDEERAKARRVRDEMIVNLVPPEDLADYDATMKEYTERLRQIEQEGRKRFMDAQAEFHEILTPAQKVKHDEMMRGRDNGHRHGREHATTQPATQKLE